VLKSILFLSEELGSIVRDFLIGVKALLYAAVGWVVLVVGFAWYRGWRTYEWRLEYCELSYVLGDRTAEEHSECIRGAIGPNPGTTWTQLYLNEWGWYAAFIPIAIGVISILAFLSVGLVAYLIEKAKQAFLSRR